jgi:alpha-mannosidase
MPVSEAIAIGQEFNHALRVIGTDVHKGRLPAAGKFVGITPTSVVLGAIKKAEDSNAMVVRVFNPGDQAVTGRIGVDTTLLGQVQGAQEVDLLERPTTESTVRVAGDTVSVKLPAHGIVSVRIKLE